jgi:hypothetical protein
MAKFDWEKAARLGANSCVSGVPFVSTCSEEEEAATAAS